MKVSVFSDEPIQVKGLKVILNTASGFQLLPVCLTLEDLMRQVLKDEPEIVLMDLTFGIAFTILSKLKAYKLNSKIILWTRSIPTELAYQAMCLGVRGILRKSMSVELHVKCLREVYAGGLWFEKELADKILCGQKVTLTQREGQVVNLLSQGLKNKEIASTLSLSEGTVKVYISNVLKKTGTCDRFELVLFGLKNFGIGDLPLAKRGHPTSNLVLNLTDSSVRSLHTMMVGEVPRHNPHDETCA